MARYWLLDKDGVVKNVVALRSAKDFRQHTKVEELPAGHPDRTDDCHVKITQEATDHNMWDAGATSMVEAKLGDGGAIGRRWDGDKFVDGPRPLENASHGDMVAELQRRGVALAPAAQS